MKPEFLDPLRTFVNQVHDISSESSKRIIQSHKEEKLISEKEASNIWKQIKTDTLKKYTTNKQIPVSASFLEDVENLSVEIDPSKKRLEALERDPNSQQHMMLVSQKEYISRVESYQKTLKQSWDSGERVQSLKIAIQSSKMLGEVSVPHFYPSIYILITDLLETFSRLVFERIRLKGASIQNGKIVPLNDDFLPTDVSSEAKEMCKNWFYKTSCIRELVPRLYLELALLECYRFLPDSDYKKIFLRISKMIRVNCIILGIGDPLVAIYTRTYFTTKCRQISMEYGREPLIEAVNDFFFTFKQQKVLNWTDIPSIQSEKIDIPNFIDLFNPGLKWIFFNISAGTSKDVFLLLLKQYKNCCNSSSVLIHMITYFSPTLISDQCFPIARLIREVDIHETSKAKLYYSLGNALIKVPPPKSLRLKLLNEVWKVVSKFKDISDYVEVSQVFIEYIMRHFTHQELGIFLSDLFKHISRVKEDIISSDNIQKGLKIIVDKILDYKINFESLLSLDSFLPLFDLLEKQARYEANKNVLHAFSKHGQPTSDPVVTNLLFDVARSIHDSLDCFNIEDELSNISFLINEFIHKVDYGHALEQQLNLCVQCRAAFPKLDSVLIELIKQVTNLAVLAHSYMNGKHTKKTRGFVKECFAVCHVTIPSVEDNITRLELFIEAARVAELNNLFVQQEAFLKAALSLIPNLSDLLNKQNDQKLTTTEFIIQYINDSRKIEKSGRSD